MRPLLSSPRPLRSSLPGRYHRPQLPGFSDSFFFPMIGCQRSIYQEGLDSPRSVKLRNRNMAAFANLVGKQSNQVLVIDILLAIGKCYKAVIGLLQLLARERKSELLQPVTQGRAAGVLAEDQVRLGHAYKGGRHNFVTERVGQHSVLMDAGFMSEGIVAHDGLVG